MASIFKGEKWTTFIIPGLLLILSIFVDLSQSGFLNYHRAAVVDWWFALKKDVLKLRNIADNEKSRGFLLIYFITSEFFTFTCDSSSFRFPLAVSFSSFLLALLLIDGDSPSENKIRWFFSERNFIPVPKSLKVPIPATAPFRLAALRLHRIEANRLSNWSTTWREATG